MPVAGGGFEQCYNAQAGVDTDTMLVVATTLTAAANDQQQVAPMLQVLTALPQDVGTVTQLLADAGYLSAANVDTCIAANIEPLIAAGRESHHLPWQERFTEPAPLPDAADVDALTQMKQRLKTLAGRALYGLRKQTVETVFGILKAVLGFRQFLLRGLDNVRAEWALVTMAWNIRRMAVLKG